MKRFIVGFNVYDTHTNCYEGEIEIRAFSHDVVEDIFKALFPHAEYAYAIPVEEGMK